MPAGVVGVVGFAGFFGGARIVGQDHGAAGKCLAAGKVVAALNLEGGGTGGGAVRGEYADDAGGGGGGQGGGDLRGRVDGECGRCGVEQNAGGIGEAGAIDRHDGSRSAGSGREGCDDRGGSLRPAERDVTPQPGPAVHGDAIDGAGHGIEADAAGVVARRIVNVVIRDEWGEGIHRRSGVDGEQGIDVTADGVEDESSRDRRGPAIPKRGPAGTVGVRWFAGFESGSGITIIDATGGSSEGAAGGEGVMHKTGDDGKAGRAGAGASGADDRERSGGGSGGHGGRE